MTRMVDPIATQATHSQRVEGGRPVGKTRWVSGATPSAGTQIQLPIHSNTSPAGSKSGWGPSTLYMPYWPVTSVSRPK
jgi:hypothetical protein